jgi:hypothetical protein
VKSSIEAINEVSRQLLSQIDMQIEHSSDADKVGNELTLTADASTSFHTAQNILTDEQLLSLVTARQHLITTLFEKYTQQQLQNQLLLINEMVLLDEQLNLKSQMHKSTLALRVLKLKKSKKVSNLYKKY